MRWHLHWFIVRHTSRGGVMSTCSEQFPSVEHILSGLASALTESSPADLRAVFEREARGMLGASSVRLREIPARFHARLVTPTRTPDSVVLGVPSADRRVQAVLEVRFAAGAGLESAGQPML